ncbi:F-actin-monooxygenase MICAL1 [Nothoprocta perdicaria]|uniref:F-actin-monooxygenase MICAL1 n=1 Tax=Nothoprocta perdicaria TaxID=30464 RepID=UPI000E1BCB54|nr:F-actin-monooxygenase MICAL1 [Nothoprocta perdicaria]
MSAPSSDAGNPAHALFERFLRAGQCQEVLGTFGELRGHLGLQGATGLQLYRELKAALNSWSAKALWNKLDKKAAHGDYEQGTACASTKCLVVGAGPCGLRTAIELALLGARVVLLEKRGSFSRNNVLHLWPFTIHDLRALGAKKFYGRFCTGTLDHISIRQLQLILLKVALLLGVEVHINVQFKGVLPPVGKGGGWRAALQPSSTLGRYSFDVLLSAGGGKFVPEGFVRKEMRGKLAIGITANFVNRHSQAEVEVAEISGVARIYNQSFFQNLYNKTGIDLENIVYYKDDTHYFVMTAKKQSLLKMGVILQDKPDTESLLAPNNVNQEALLSYAKEAANFSTNYCLPQLEFARNHRDEPDVDMFDFTCMMRSENAALVREQHGSRLLLGLVGDCLVEPFWPLGTGVARGFLAALDAAWMVRRWAAGAPPLHVLAERESIYQLLSQTSPDNTSKNVSQYSIDPATRYPNLNLGAIKPSQVQDLYLCGMVDVDHKGKSTERLSTVSGDAYEELLSWCQASTGGDVEVTDFTCSWRSGRALGALLQRFRPDLMDFDSLDALEPVQRHQKLLDVAEQELGIQPVLSSAEMASMAESDRLGLITYLSQFYEAFKPSPEDVAVNSVPSRGTKGAILFLSKLQKSRNLTLKRAQDGAQKDAKPKRSRREAETDLGLGGDVQDGVCEQPPMDPSQAAARGESSDACYFCARRVYIVERVSAEGRFFHRGCFRCRRCGATLRLGDYAFDAEHGHFYCLLHDPNLHSMDLPQDEAPLLPQRDVPTGPSSPVTGSPCVIPEEAAPAQLPVVPVPPQAPAPESLLESPQESLPVSPPESLPESPPPESLLELLPESPTSESLVESPSPESLPDSPSAEPDRAEEPEAAPGAMEEQGPGAEPHGEDEEGNESGGRRKIMLTPLEKLKLSTLSLTGDAEPQPPPKPARLMLMAPGRRSGHWEDEEEEEEDLEESSSEEEEEEEESSDLGTEPVPVLEESERLATWTRLLPRQAREAQMKRFCKAQAIQRRLEEIEVTFGELEQQGVKLEKLLREESASPAELRTQWMNELLYLVQKKNSLVSEESDLMITVQELKLEEQQSRLDQQLRRFMSKEEVQKTPAERAAEQETLARLLEVVNQRNALIHVQEERRLSELQH